MVDIPVWCLVFVVISSFVIGGEVALLVEHSFEKKDDSWFCGSDGICVPIDQMVQPVTYGDVMLYMDNQSR